MSILDQLIEEIIIEKNLEIKIFAFGSFVCGEQYSDIDILLVYGNIEYSQVKDVKRRISDGLQKEYFVPVHFTTLSVEECLEIDIDRYGKRKLLYDGFPNKDISLTET